MAEFQPIKGVTVIGVGYRAESGKSTVAKRWMRTHGAERFELSTYVATVARVHYGMRERDVERLIATGEGLRRIDPQTWTRCAYYDMADKRPEIAVIPNVRTSDEVALVRAMGGVLVRTRRLTPDGRLYLSPSRDPNGRLECGLDHYQGWDHYIDASTVESLVAQADDVIARIVECRHAAA